MSEMAVVTKFILPSPQYIELRFPDGTHSGARYDPIRGVLEVQKRGIKHVFDLSEVVQTIDKCKKLCDNTI